MQGLSAAQHAQPRGAAEPGWAASLTGVGHGRAAGLAPWAPDFGGVHRRLGCVDGSLFLKLPHVLFIPDSFVAEPIGDL